MPRKIFWLLAFVFTLAGHASAQTTLFGSAYIGSAGAATLYSINPATGVATAVGPIGFNRVGGLATSPSGILFGLGYDGTDSILIRINTTTGVGTLVGSTGVTDATQDMAFRADGTLFAYMGGSIYTVNTATGVATLVGNTGTFPDGNAIAFNGGTLLLANTNGLQSVNQTTGAVTLIAPLTFGAGFTPANNPRVAGMKFDPSSGSLIGAVIENGGGRFEARINPATGAVTDVGTTVAGLDAVAFASPAGIAAVPTLSPLVQALLAAILAAVAFYFLAGPVTRSVQALFSGGMAGRWRKV